MEKYGIVVLFIITVVTITGYLLFKNKSRLSDFHKKLSLTAALALIIIYSKMIIQNWEYMKIFKKLQILNVVFLVLGGISLFYSKIIPIENQNKFDKFINKYGLLIMVLLLGVLYILKKFLN